jgi:signal transduction histidine kinase
MFRGLRWRLTVLYALASAVLLLLAGSGAYALLDYYFRSNTDLAMQSRLAFDLRRLGAAVPAPLSAAEQRWYGSRGLAVPPVHRDQDDHDHPGEFGADNFDSELASIYELSLSAQGTPLAGGPATANAGPASDQPAVAAALANGLDWRTTRLAGGTRVRLLTFRVEGASQGPAVLQLGRTLSDQDRVLNSFLLGLLALGAAAALLVGAASWWLAGRSLAPAHAAWEKQQAFVANASHELRTPLTLVRATAEVAQRGLPVEDERHGLLSDILSECDHMGRLVEDLLLLSRLDAHALKLLRQPVEAGELLGDVQRQMGRLAADQQVRLEVGSAAGRVVADPARLRQVLLIVLDNALRHTPAGGRVVLAAAPAGRSIEISVTDTGSGIAPEHLPHVFDRFYQANPARGGGGTGLGLAIARSLIMAQGGQISLHSQSGAGTRVTVRLPAAAS